MSLDAFFASGAVAWLILAVMVMEAFLLAKLLSGGGLRGAVLAGLAAGACLVLALRAALTQGDVLEIALFLAMSAIAHVVEIRLWLGVRNKK
jgi:hypothetical protein